MKRGATKLAPRFIGLRSTFALPVSGVAAPDDLYQATKHATTFVRVFAQLISCVRIQRLYVSRNE